MGVQRHFSQTGRDAGVQQEGGSAHGDVSICPYKGEFLGSTKSRLLQQHGFISRANRAKQKQSSQTQKG